jgi:hypothetical protein
MLQIKIEHSVFLCNILSLKLAFSRRRILQGHALRMRGAFLVAFLHGMPVPRLWALEMSPFFIFFVKNGTKDHSMKYRR